jgi:hypothetical protein
VIANAVIVTVGEMNDELMIDVMKGVTKDLDQIVNEEEELEETGIHMTEIAVIEIVVIEALTEVVMEVIVVIVIVLMNELLLLLVVMTVVEVVMMVVEEDEMQVEIVVEMVVEMVVVTVVEKEKENQDVRNQDVVMMVLENLVVMNHHVKKQSERNRHPRSCAQRIQTVGMFLQLVMNTSHQCSIKNSFFADSFLHLHDPWLFQQMHKLELWEILSVVLCSEP